MTTIKTFFDLSSFLINTLIVSLFMLLNPFYVLFLSSLINIFSKKINHFIFLFLFALSFALMFTNSNPALVGDSIFYIQRYSENLNIIQQGFTAEPFWVLYRQFLFLVFNGDQDFFVVFSYFSLFLILAIIAKLAFKDKYVIGLFFLIFFNLALLYGLKQLWRHELAVLLFFIGVYSIRFRLLIYITPLIHIVTLPFMLIITKINFKSMLIFIAIMILVFGHILSRIESYQLEPTSTYSNPFFLLAVILIFTLKNLRLINLNFRENRIYYAYIFFAILPYFFAISSAYQVMHGRIAIIFMFFTSIIFAKLAIRTRFLSFILIITYFIYRMAYSFQNPVIFSELKSLGDDRPLYIYNGIISLINNYDLNRWSDYLL